MKTCLRLTEYEIELDVKKIYSLIIIAAYFNQSFRECSRAFVKLDAIKDMTEEEKERYENIAVTIFTKHKLIDENS